jgi:endonuclease/exonuclease/phosphatase (EEP) superfamily protein YafD
MVIWSLLYLVLAGFIVSTLVGFFGHYWWVFELFSHFRVQYFIATFLFALVFALFGKFTAAILAGSSALLNLLLLTPLYFRRKGPKAPGEVHRFLLANVNTSNPYHDKVRKLIEKTSPDLIVLVEVDQNWLDDLSLEEFGYVCSAAEPREDNYGIALFSRLPFISGEVVRFGGLGVPTVLTRLHQGRTILNIIGSHPPPPKSRRLARYRDQQLEEIMDFTRNLEGAVIFCGDFNLTSWSPRFKRLLERGELHDTRQGFGVQGTWPTWMPLFFIPIDHIWISSNIQVHCRRVGPRIGSDHQPVVLDFSIMARNEAGKFRLT